MPHPISFQVIVPKSTSRPHLRVVEFIDEVAVSWHEELVRELFLLVDVDVILNIPLCPSWPQAKLMWHYTNDRTFTVRSTYHLLIQEVVHSNDECSPKSSRDIWRSGSSTSLLTYRFPFGACARAFYQREITCPKDSPPSTCGVLFAATLRKVIPRHYWTAHWHLKFGNTVPSLRGSSLDLFGVLRTVCTMANVTLMLMHLGTLWQFYGRFGMLRTASFSLALTMIQLPSVNELSPLLLTSAMLVSWSLLWPRLTLFYCNHLILAPTN